MTLAQLHAPGVDISIQELEYDLYVPQVDMIMTAKLGPRLSYKWCDPRCGWWTPFLWEEKNRWWMCRYILQDLYPITTCIYKQVSTYLHDVPSGYNRVPAYNIWYISVFHCKSVYRSKLHMPFPWHASSSIDPVAVGSSKERETRVCVPLPLPPFFPHRRIDPKAVESWTHHRFSLSLSASSSPELTCLLRSFTNILNLRKHHSHRPLPPTLDSELLLQLCLT